MYIFTKYYVYQIKEGEIYSGAWITVKCVQNFIWNAWRQDATVRPSHIREDNIRMDFRKTEFVREVINSYDSVYGPVAAFVNVVMDLRVPRIKGISWLNEVLKKDSGQSSWNRNEVGTILLWIRTSYAKQ